MLDLAVIGLEHLGQGDLRLFGLLQGYLLVVGPWLMLAAALLWLLLGRRDFEECCIVLVVSVLLLAASCQFDDHMRVPEKGMAAERLADELDTCCCK